jgi:acyl-CoA-binding protein
MSDLAHQFATAAEAVRKLPKKPDNTDLLKLYALFKQGSTGDVTGDRPGMMDFVGRAKYDAWSDIEGMDREEAKKAYVDLVDSLTPE